MRGSFSVSLAHDNHLSRVEGTGLGPENCKPLWDKVVRQGTGTKKSWMGGRG